MPGPLPKPPEERQRRNARDLGAVTAPTGEAPEPPADLVPAATAGWAAYWGDVVAGAIRPSDASLVDRWVRNLDRYHRMLSLADADPVVTGSTGQLKPNGLYALAYQIEASIKQDEQQLGIGPLNRLRLGVKIAEAQTSLADLTADAEGGADDDDPRAFLTG
ncbi:hypothetical protein [Kitasatospora sp. GP82]|uniref:phage terminase small subunit n=1 Tax=Kitasatospora sp. GP82 TaxID=3035089 RepID=UPI00247583AF|nr:hypothetical protein [Kitasatospora sp. GP82]MDH6123432.1 hypothetical protein [Kitasatospora sp. GP82]